MRWAVLAGVLIGTGLGVEVGRYSPGGALITAGIAVFLIDVYLSWKEHRE